MSLLLWLAIIFAAHMQLVIHGIRSPVGIVVIPGICDLLEHLIQRGLFTVVGDDRHFRVPVPVGFRNILFQCGFFDGGFTHPAIAIDVDRVCLSIHDLSVTEGGAAQENGGHRYHRFKKWVHVYLDFTRQVHSRLVIQRYWEENMRKAAMVFHTGSPL